MTIHSDNFAAVIFSEEIDLHCDVLIHASAELEEAAAHYINLYHGIDCDLPYPPRRTFELCTNALNAAKSIKNILFGNEKKKATIVRAKKIHQMLLSPPLIAISKCDTRNAWEHMDEKLDVYLSQPGGKSIEYLYVYDGLYPSNPNTHYLRTFNPKTMEVRYHNITTCIRSMAAEAADLKTRTEDAHRRMKDGQVFAIFE